MKTPQNQKSILSFFAPQAKGIQKSFHSEKNNVSKKSPKKLADEDSPIKKVTSHRRRAIESDSEEDEESPTAGTSRKEDVDESSSPLRKRSRASSPILLEDQKNEPCKDESPVASSSASRPSDIGFSPETVPPLRKTARKKMLRESGAVEEHQLEMVKRIKSPSIKEKDAHSPTKETNKFKIKNNEPSGLDSSKKGKRTNCLDRFVFVKTERNKASDQEKRESFDSSKNSKDTSVENGDKDSSPKKISQKEASPAPITPASHSEKEASPQNNTSKRRRSSRKKSQTSEKVVSPKIKKSPQKSAKHTVSSDEDESCISPSAIAEDSSANEDSPVKSTPPSNNKSAIKTPFVIAKQSSKTGEFNPAKSKYHPIDDAFWKKGEDVPFSALSKTFEIIEDTSGRLKTIEILSNFLRSVIVLSPDDLLYCIYLCLNKVAPSFEGIELGVGEIYVCRAVAQVTGRSVDKIKNEITEKGDLGIVAEHSKSNQRMMFQPPPLRVKKVFKSVKEIALMSGQASQTKKIDKIKTMLVACKGAESRFLIRFFGGKLRIGLAEQSVLQAIAQACFLTPPGQTYPPEKLNEGKGLSAENLKAKIEEHAAILKTTYCECPSFDSIVPVVLEKGMKELPNYCKLQPGVPLKPMLAHPTKGVAEVLKRFDKSKFTCEFKYDGERAQIHLKEDGNISIFSRNQENNTSKYPDIIARLKDSLGPDVKSCILDSEAVAYDVENKKILPFQILSTRKRKDANESEIKVQVCVFPFDLLYFNGQNLVTEPLEVRRDLMRKNFVEREGQFTFAKSIDSTDTEDIEKFLDESVKGNCEGLMVKSLDVDATYEIAKRSRNWLKLKKDYLEGVGDTIDVVVIGGFNGQGNRTGTYGGFLLACYDPESEEYQSLCKIGTGFTEEVLQKHTTFFKEHVIESPKSYYRFSSSLTPDDWFEPVQVWEIKCADLSVSPVHMAAIGIVDPEKGISLRFPRFLRIRDDKSPEDATSAVQIAELYRSQEQIKNQSEDNNNLEEYFY